MSIELLSSATKITSLKLHRCPAPELRFSRSSLPLPSKHWQAPRTHLFCLPRNFWSTLSVYFQEAQRFERRKQKGGLYKAPLQCISEQHLVWSQRTKKREWKTKVGLSMRTRSPSITARTHNTLHSKGTNVRERQRGRHILKTRVLSPTLRRSHSLPKTGHSTSIRTLTPS